MIASVVDTGDKFITGVRDTGDKFIAGVVDTAEQHLLSVSRTQTPWKSWKEYIGAKSATAADGVIGTPRHEKLHP